jgi:hypothetical protein
MLTNLNFLNDFRDHDGNVGVALVHADRILVHGLMEQRRQV